MGDTRWRSRRVAVLMMEVVLVQVFVLERLVDVLVFVVLGDVQPHAGRHEDRPRDEPPVDGIAEQRNGAERPAERRRREEGAGPRGPELARRPHEPDQAPAETDKPADT